MARTKRGNGEGSIYQRADGLWAASVSLPPDPLTGKARRRTVTSKSRNVVIGKLRELRAELDRAGDMPTSSPRLSEWLEQWDGRHLATLKPKAASAYRTAIRNYIDPSIGKIRLDRLTPADVHRMHDYITDTRRLSTSTANQAHRTLRKALTDAQRQGIVTRNVATLVSPPPLAVVTRPHLGAQQAASLLYQHRTDPHLALSLSLALLTGMRQGERLGLTWGAIDQDRGIITVSWQLQALTYTHGCEPACGRKRGADCPARRFDYPAGHEIIQVRGGLHLLRPKSRKGWREVPMAPVLAEALKLYRRDHYRPHEHDLVLVRADGAAIPPRQDWQAWKDALAAADLPDLPLHSARHTTATLLHELGVPEQVRMQILGHASATVTQGYTHVAAAEAVAAMGALGRLLDSA
ncbi:tyrosine-type recombinase/integrase [Pseudactinotalea sp. HY158]|uniref:tyrosine-type recombinase/integrase n=1 Tax=Pseudactinotalea sp. HY158 TaxID=2654547 RepID=UPI0018924E1C|nr:tyrosine-type recombinase/integrase [Pseudactinotalea sp. HY158]